MRPHRFGRGPQGPHDGMAGAEPGRKQGRVRWSALVPELERRKPVGELGAGRGGRQSAAHGGSASGLSRAAACGRCASAGRPPHILALWPNLGEARLTPPARPPLVTPGQRSMHPAWHGDTEGFSWGGMRDAGRARGRQTEWQGSGWQASRNAAAGRLRQRTRGEDTRTWRMDENLEQCLLGGWCLVPPWTQPFSNGEWIRPRGEAATRRAGQRRGGEAASPACR